MSDDKRGRDPRWEPIDRALGGRFRDGAECPEYVFDLFQLARAEAAGQLLPDTADSLHEHFEVCPVCRRIYQSALAAAQGGETELPKRDAQPELETTPATALGDGRQAAAPASRRPWSIPVWWDQATVRDAAPPADRTATLRVFWTAEQTVQFAPRGFLLPGPDERLELTWCSAEGVPLVPPTWIEGEKTFTELPAPPRPPQTGDRLQLRLRDKDDSVVLQVEVEVP